MPICQKCKRKFPISVKIDNVERNLQRRKYCLDCTPFGTHNTKVLSPREHLGDMELVCATCGETYIFRKKSSATQEKCTNCVAKERRLRIKQDAVSYLGGKCSICGYDKSLRALQFHHINPSEKEFSISGTIHSIERTKKELDKCILVCSNCHAEIHDKYDHMV